MVHAFSKIILGLLILASPLFVCQFPETASAQSSMKNIKKKKKKVRRRDRGQNAVVIVDGSAVYKAQNFDAPVMEYLDRGKRVKISKKVYKGIGGLGTFYKIRLRKGVYGYITDVDIEISGQSGVQATRKQLENGNNIENDPLKLRDDLQNNTGVPDTGESIYLTRYLGVSYSSVNYTEEIAGSSESSNEGLIGVKMSGPGQWLGGMPLDIEVQILTSTPSFYDDFSTSSSGMMLITHAYAMFPLIESPRNVLYYQFGPMLKYVSFDVNLKNDSPDLGGIDSQEVTLGAGLGLGWAMRLGQRWALRFEGVYTYEKEAYFGFGGALQMRY